MTPKKIAIVGGGVSGLAAAWQLQSVHNVTLFEAAGQLGGHVCTVQVDSLTGKPAYQADLGVIVVNQVGYPNLFSAYQVLGVETDPCDFSIAAAFGSKSESWGTAQQLKSSALFQRIARDCETFESSLKSLPTPPDVGVTLQAWCSDLGLSDEFVFKALMPILIALQLSRSALLETPVAYIQPLFMFGGLSFLNTPKWHRIRGGSAAVLAAIEQRLTIEPRLGTRVTKVVRPAGGPDQSVEVQWQVDGGPAISDSFDEVIIACQLDVAKNMLTESLTAAEHKLLSAFEYESLDIYVHRDTSVLSPDLPPSLLQYRLDANDGTPGADLQGSVVFNPFAVGSGTGLQLSQTDAPLISYCWPNGARIPNGDSIIARRRFEHLIQGPATARACAELSTLQGKGHVWFAGHSAAAPGNWHEGAFTAGLVIADALGADYPFRGEAISEFIFKKTRNHMLPRPTSMT